MRKMTEEALKCLFIYSGRDIDFDYSKLTSAEKDLVTKEQYDEIVTWAKGNNFELQAKHPAIEYMTIDKSFAMAEPSLKEFGDDGWTMRSVVETGGGSFRYYFTRLKRD